MKTINSILLFSFISFIISACSGPKSSGGLSNMVAVMEIKESIPGLCDPSFVIAPLPLAGNGQVKAVAPMSDEEIEATLNEQVMFLKDKPDYKDKGMVALIVNCEGKMLQCKIDNKTQSPELDKQIVAVFAELKTWEPGSINGKPVDTSVLYSFEIVDGRIKL